MPRDFTYIPPGFAFAWVRRPCVKALLLALLAVSLCAAAEPDGKADTKTKGYNCLFLGHSFFAPIASQFGQHPARCGFSGHKQTVVMHGGQNGSPGYLWNCQSPDVIHARELLATGTVDLLGMTYFPGAGSDVPDYRHWIDLALRYNPKTEVFIQLPWPMFRGKTPAAYESESAKGTVIIHRTIDRLRQTYPKTTFLFIPQVRRWSPSGNCTTRGNSRK